MRNLILLQENRQEVSLNLQSNTEAAACELAFDPADTSRGRGSLGIPLKTYVLVNNGLLICCTSRSKDYDNFTESVEWTCDLTKLDKCNDENKNSWFQATFIDEIEAIVVLSHSGIIATVSPQTGDANCVGVFENGIFAAKWSPDMELLSLCTREGHGEDIRTVMLTMNTAFDIVAEVQLEAALYPSLSRQDSNSISMCWKPDGKLVAVSSVDASDGIRRIRIYNRDSLELHGIGLSEDGSGRIVPNITPAKIGWAGIGCSILLTGVQTSGKKSCKIIFFEPNGLRHKDFSLRNVNNAIEKVSQVTWNIESDLLAVTITSTSDQGAPSKVQLWHRNNYHWYLKYELRYDTLVTMTQFDPENPYRLLVTMASSSQSCSSNGICWRIYDFCWDVHSSITGIATTVSIDGSDLNITPLGKALVPPPMSACTLNMSEYGDSIIGVAFSPSCSTQLCFEMVIHLSNGELIFIGKTNQHTSRNQASCLIANYTAPDVLGSAKIDTLMNGSVHTELRQFIVVGYEGGIARMICIRCAVGSCSTETLFVFDANLTCLEQVDGESASNIQLKLIDQIKLCGKVLRITNWLDSDKKCLIELNDGSLIQYTSTDGAVFPLNLEPMLEPCPWITAVMMPTAHAFEIGLSDHQEEKHIDHFHRKELIVGLSLRKRLYCCEQLLCSSASTFAVSTFHRFVIYVSLGSRAQLHFIPLYSLANWDPLSGAEEFILDGYEPRQVERGSRLVAVLQTSPSVVLQMPRGNIEAVVPRALTLPFCMMLIDQKQYGKAFDLMRRNKVDLNLLVDLHPQTFLNYINLFLHEVRISDHLNLFISCLFNGDITSFKYQVPEWMVLGTNMKAQTDSNFDFSAKVNLVCTSMRVQMLEIENKSESDRGRFLLPILSTFAKEIPPKLEGALDLIRERALEKAEKDSKNRLKVMLSEKCQQSIQYLAFLSNYELIFNTALGMYDWDLAKAVARNSQMDPKVYLSLIKRLSSMEDQERARYEVNIKLERFEMALKCLARCHAEENLFQTCLQLVEQYGLHKVGLEIFKDQPDKHRQILLSLGEKLLQEKKSSAALSIFLSAKPRDLDGAIRAARSCHDWKSLFSCLSEAGNSDEFYAQSLKETASEVAQELLDYGSSLTGKSRQECYLSSARVLLDYALDLEGAVDTLILGYEWTEGYRVSTSVGRTDLAHRCIDSAVSYAEICAEDLQERAQTFEITNEQYRLSLSLRRAALQQAFEEGELLNDSGSVYSISSQASSNSLMSNLSGSSAVSSSSYSSVISAGASSTFSLTQKTNKHKSKYNQLGAGQTKQKKNKNQKKGKNRIKRGSEEDLKVLVGTLKQCCVWEDEFKQIVETVAFLTHMGRFESAYALYNKYNYFRKLMDTNRNVKKSEKSKQYGLERLDEHIDILVPGEQEVEDLQCGDFPEYLHDVFLYLNV